MSNVRSTMNEPRIIRSFPSRHPKDGFRFHEVSQQPDGSLTCTCPAAAHGIKCWAVMKVAGEFEVARILGKKIEIQPQFDMRGHLERIRREAQEGLAACMKEFKEPTLEQIKACWAETEKLLAISKKNYNDSKWAAYYAQFKAENNND